MTDHLTDAELDELWAKAKAYAQGGITGAGQRLTDFREAANPTTIQRLIAEVREARKGDHDV